MGGKVDLKNVPLGAWIFATVGLVSLLASFVVLAVMGADSAELRWLVLTILNAGTGLAATGAIIYSGAAAKNAQDSASQTNGQLDRRDAEIADLRRQILTIGRDGRG